MENCGEVLDFSGQQNVFFSHTLRGVRDQFDMDLVKGIRPVRMVVHFLGLECDRSDEAERFDKIVELEIRADAPPHIFPTREDFDRVVEFFFFEGVIHGPHSLQAET